ncbi:AMP-binding protein [Stenotrophomonas maltophilia]|uniref:AMP-binding protein n=1 Tax=Stenotrophomonas maltophilia TaxID=40324 RepID=UPI0013DA0FA2|nr:AMP-binding protein [Stenotrophomonas maltophilia]
MSAAAQEFLRLLQAHRQPVLGAHGTLTASALHSRVRGLAQWLQRSGVGCVASRLDNGPDWMVLDLALRIADVAHVPLPTFFSQEQAQHALQSSAAQLLVTAGNALAQHGEADAEALPGLDAHAAWLHAPASVVLPAGTACVTYTSGSTGHPRGVCLSAETLLTVAGSLTDAAAEIAPKRHLCLMPLSTLLENVAGLYAAVLSGAEIALPSLQEVGYTGAAGLDVPTLIRCLHRYQPESIILVPQLLLALVMAAEQGAALPASLRYLAVGGGRVAPQLLARARRLNLPVFEGYGLTECGSVVCLNRPGAQRDGSVGQPLPHAQVQIVDGEIVVAGSRALGYLGGEPLAPGPIHTGDLGHIDADGYVHVTGRRKNVFITAFGRNVSPEWVESELLSHPAIAQALVWGEARADNVAVLVPRFPQQGTQALEAALAAINAGLPDYARIARYVLATPFTAQSGLLTANGRPRREAILAHYQAGIDAAYGQLAFSSTGDHA